MDVAALEPIATAIQGFLVAALIVGGPVLLVIGFVMMAFSGINPQWKQRGIEIVKWTIFGSIGVGLVAVILWTFVQDNTALNDMLG